MGSTTEFNGMFTFYGEPSVSVIRQINDLRKVKWQVDPRVPQSYCQWIVSDNLDGIVWDGGEKFYCYTEWLQHIIDNILKPAGLTLCGSVECSGDSVGRLVINNDVAQKMSYESIVVAYDILLKFYDFVLVNHPNVLADFKSKTGV